MLQTSGVGGPPPRSAHFYSKAGKKTFTGNPDLHPLLDFPKRDYEPRCPVLNLVYTLGELEYSKTADGKPDTVLLHLLERVLRNLPPARRARLSFTSGDKDPYLERIRKNLLLIGMDPVLTFQERRKQSRLLREERTRMLGTKCRLHGRSLFLRKISVRLGDVPGFLACVRKRPRDHLASFLGASLVSPVKSFFGMVRGNLGYSIALAIYSPFTFFFITQPMNPHAMRAVGAVRSAIVEWSDGIRNRWLAETPTVRTPLGLRSGAPPLRPKTAGILLSSDVPEVEKQTWEERMGRFKAMQIAYEGDLEIAPRMGRLEQIETQLNWPLILEGTWMESVRYSAFLSFLLSNRSQYKTVFLQFVEAELKRVDQVQLYLWDREIRFFLDHPFILMDETREQVASLVYAGRGFLQLRDMTRTLLQRHPELPLPEGYERIMNQARRYELASIAGEQHGPGGIVDRLRSRSAIFARQDRWSTHALRSDLRRHWEVLYLLQNRTQEASNTGLQMYVWSTRTMISLLQTLYGAKREELSLLSLSFKNGAKPQKISENDEWRRIDSQYEAILHQMTLEFVSIRRELGEELAGDIEAIQRKTILEGVESFLNEREAILHAPGIL
ncbi:MAG: hypothetical protein EBX52_05080 [Proteobacteria bacterium]|nr:hypothetical protein [Pseudomonadota bacterium]